MERIISLLIFLLASALQLNVSPWYDVKAYGALGNGKFGSDGATTARSVTFTSASAPFKCSTDVGKVIEIEGAGDAGVPLLTTISACASSSSVTLAASAGTSTAAQKFFFGNDDSAAFQSAIDVAQSAGGGTIFAPAGTYIASNLTTGPSGGYNKQGVSIKGTCSFTGAGVITRNPLQTYCTSILDGSNKPTITVYGGNDEFEISGIMFFSFPRSSAEFIQLQGTSCCEVRDGHIVNNAFWGKNWNILATNTIENVQVEHNMSGCAAIGFVWFQPTAGYSHNKIAVDDNYVDYSGFSDCASLPTYGIKIGSTTAGAAAATSITVRGNEIQNATAKGAVAIGCYGCFSIHVEDNDIEDNNVSPGNWAYGIDVEPGAVGAGSSGFIGPNEIMWSSAMTAPVEIVNNPGLLIASQQITGAAPSVGIVISGGGNEIVQTPVDNVGTITTPVQQTGGTSNNLILGGQYPYTGSYAASISTDSSNHVFIGGTSVIYRCAMAGTLPVGALTVNKEDCGASTDTGLRVK